jgi:hypothetical protein
MATDAFAPFRLRSRSSLADAEATAAEAGASPLVVDPSEPLPEGLAARTVALVPASTADRPEEACRAADGTLAGVAGRERPCLHAEPFRSRIAESALAALAAGHAGALIDRLDASLSLGLFGAGFSDACLEAFLARLRREYGSQFERLDMRRLAGEALAVAPGAVTFEQVHFGRDFWRFRNDSLSEALGGLVLRTRDAARAARRPFTVAAGFESAGPAQFACTRHLDGAVFPLRAGQTGLAAGRLWRAVLGRRGAAAALPAGTGPDDAGRIAASLACSGVGVAFDEPGLAEALGPTTRLLREHVDRRAGLAFAEPVAECALLYSAESDLWTQGVHRAAVEEAGEALARAQVQWSVALSPAGLRPGTVLVLAQAAALAPAEAAAVRRFLESGGAILALGTPGQVDSSGRPIVPFLPEGRASGLRVGDGTLVSLPALAPGAAEAEPIARAVETLRPTGGRAAEVTAPAPVQASLWRSPKRLDVHLVSLAGEPVQDATLFLDDEVAGGARRARFRSASGADEKFAVHPGRRSLSAVLPPFRGYAVLSLVP